uniref:Putative secreted protein n=1 Tax=Ixodes ricinus TaxID=34613 RepID=A0A6B0UCX3_IXORI
MLRRYTRGPVVAGLTGQATCSLLPALAWPPLRAELLLPRGDPLRRYARFKVLATPAEFLAVMRPSAVARCADAEYGVGSAGTLLLRAEC